VAARWRGARGCNGSARRTARKKPVRAFAGLSWAGILERPRPPKKENKFKALQRAKTLSSTRILASEHVLDVEVFGGRGWQHAISSGGVAIQVCRLRQRALVERTR
jgi:hypothetical protein